ncbi:hypothetical protein ACFLTP_07365 [Chloroflexota bacterium]
MRILCAMITHFPLRCEVQRQMSLDYRAVIVTYTSGSQKLVLDYSPELEDLQRDIPLRHALARHGEVKLLSADMPYYQAVFTELLNALEGISPLMEGAELGCIYIVVDGLHSIYPNDDAIINAVSGIIPEVFTPQIGIAGNKFLAHLAACRCPPGRQQVLTGDVATFLRGFSCDVLPISMKNRRKLHEFGLHTLGQVATLPAGPLLSQFGTEGKKIYELARGLDNTPLYPRMMEEAIEESVTLSSVTVSLKVILVVLESLLSMVFNRIGHSGFGICSLIVWTRTWNSEQWERTIRFKEPAMNIKTVGTRIKWIMEEYPQPGPVDQVGLNINRLSYPGGQQNSLFRNIRSQVNLMEDIRQLELRLGNPQVYRIKEMEPWSRIPERRYILAPTRR